jgi:uncharacterized membrane protein YedE/YeeE
MLPFIFKTRVRAYFEVAIVSLLWFAFGGVLGIAASYLWKWIGGGTQAQWQIVVAFVAVFLLPYLVIAARVWDVNLSVFGTQAQRVKAEAVAGRPVERI